MEKVGLDIKGNSGKVVFTDNQFAPFPALSETSAQMKVFDLSDLTPLQDPKETVWIKILQNLSQKSHICLQHPPFLQVPNREGIL